MRIPSFVVSRLVGLATNRSARHGLNSPLAAARAAVSRRVVSNSWRNMGSSLVVEAIDSLSATESESKARRTYIVLGYSEEDEDGT
jgi:hypothetical protein